MPTHNRLELLSYAIDTVLQQTFGDFEVIVSDNSSAEDIKGYLETLGDSRVKYFRTEKFVSVTENWNNTIRHSSGEYLVMLGDDDALLLDGLETLDRVIREFGGPDYLITNAIQYAYPGVVPDCTKGFVQRPFLPLLENKDKPYLLDKAEATSIVRKSCQFYLPLVYNMQHSVVNRKMIKIMEVKGEFFHSPYPDYYATNALLLTSESIVVNPIATAVVGISPKSFGYYYFNDMESRGNEVLNNRIEDELFKTIKKYILPGSEMNTSWLAAMELVVENFGKKLGLKVNYQRYRDIQIFLAFEQGREQFFQRLYHRIKFSERIKLWLFRYWFKFKKKTNRFYEWRDFAVDLREVWFPYPKYDLQKKEVDFLNIIDLVKADGWVKDYVAHFNDYQPGHQYISFWRQFKNDILNMLYDWKSKLRNEFKVISPMDWDTISEPKIIFQINKIFLPEIECRFVDMETNQEYPCTIKKTGKLCEYTALPKEYLKSGKYIVDIHRPKESVSLSRTAAVVERIENTQSQTIQTEWAKIFYKEMKSRFSKRNNSVVVDEINVNTPHFSILTTVFNTSIRFLTELVESVLDQSFYDFEWIILDNGSSDREVVEYLKVISSKHSKIKLYRVEKNIHIIPGNRYIFEKAKGKYIIPIDSDDILYKDALEIISKYTKENPNIECFYSDEHTIDEKGEPQVPYFRRVSFSLLYSYSTCPFSHLTVIKREKGLEVGLYTDDYAKGSHDWDSALRLSESGAKFKHIPSVLYGWRMHENSSSSSMTSKPYAVHSQKENLIHSLKRRGLDRKFSIGNIVEGYYHLIRHTFDGPKVALHIYVPVEKYLESLIRNLKLTRYDNIFIHIYLPKVLLKRKDYIEASILEFSKTRRFTIYYFETLVRLPEMILENNNQSIVAILNSSNRLVNPNWIWDAVGTFELDEKVEIVGGQIVGADQEIIHSGLYKCADGFDSKPDHNLEIKGLVPDHELVRSEVDAIYSGGCVFKASLLNDGFKFEGLDDDSCKYGIQLSNFVKARGFIVAFSPKIKLSRSSLSVY